MNPQIEAAREAANTAQGRFLRALDAVPDDRLNWSPAPTAKSALAIAAHSAASHRFFATILRGEQLPAGTAHELHEVAAAAEQSLNTREAVVAALHAGAREIDDALAGMPDDRIAGTVTMPMMEAPMAFFMALPAIHLHGHASQIDYLQTVWGDTEMRF